MTEPNLSAEKIRTLEACMEMGRSIMCKKQFLESKITAKKEAATRTTGETQKWHEGYIAGLEDGVRALQAFLDEYS